MSNARSSYGASLEVGTDGNTYAQISGAEVIDINGPEKTTGEMKATHLLSPDTTEETKAGLKKPGKVTLKMAFINTALTQVEGYYENRTLLYWSIVFPIDADLGEVTAATYKGRGFVCKIGSAFPDADSDERITQDVEIRCSGKWTFTPAT